MAEYPKLQDYTADLPTTIDVPELRDVVIAHARSQEVLRVRHETSLALALACAAAYEEGMCSHGLIAKTIGVSRQRVKQLVEKGRFLRGEPVKKPKPRKDKA